MKNPCFHDRPAPGCRLIRDLSLDPAGEGAYTGTTRSGRAAPGRSFGGALVAQALLAAGATAPAGLSPGSVHAYFVTPGDSTRPVRYTVTALGEGQSWALRQVTADQDGTVRLSAQASFRRFRTTAGSEHQRPAPDGALEEPPEPGPGGDGCGCVAGYGFHIPGCGTDSREAESKADSGSAPGAHRATWLRARHDLGELPAWHAALLAYASDIGSIGVVDLPHAAEPGIRRAASVDHAVWFHRPFRFDDWLWYGQRSPVLTGGRGLFEGGFYDGGGRLVASVTQEVAIRRIVRTSDGA